MRLPDLVKRATIIDEVQIIGWGVSNGARRKPTGRYGILVRIRAHRGSAKLVGTAERTIRRSVVERRWRSLRRVAKTLVEIRLRDGADLETGSRQVTEALRSLGSAEFDTSLQSMTTMIERFDTVPGAAAPYTGDCNEFDSELVKSPGMRTSTQQLEMEALLGGLETRRVDKRMLLVGEPMRPPALAFHRSASSHASFPGCQIAQDKLVAQMTLRSAGIGVPSGSTVPIHDKSEIERVAKSIGFPLAVKPVSGQQASGVTTGIQEWDRFWYAVDRAAAECETDWVGTVPEVFSHEEVLIEQSLTGVEYRVFATADRTLAVLQKLRPHVVGNGRHTVAELITWATAIRSRNLAMRSRPFDLETVKAILEEQGLDMEYVPDSGETVTLSRLTAAGPGGAYRQVLDTAHPSLLELGPAVIAEVGLPYGGVDLIMTDHTIPVGEQEVNVIEVNSQAGLMNCSYPLYGQGIEVGRVVLAESARCHGLPFEPGDGGLRVSCLVTGKVQGVGYRAWFAAHAAETGIDGWIANCRSGDQVEMVLVGDPVKVSSLVYLAYRGPRRARPVEVRTRPAAVDVTPGFRIRDTKEET